VPRSPIETLAAVMPSVPLALPLTDTVVSTETSAAVADATFEDAVDPET
jgi:hypothetical protein